MRADFADGPVKDDRKRLSNAAAAPDRPFVLVVDDDPGMREGLHDLFASVGLDTSVFESVEALLRHPLPDRPSCLVLDLRLPGVNGLELQRRLAKDDVNLPIVFVTGHADVFSSVRAMKAGAVDFLAKPLRSQELLDAVNEAIAASAARREAESGLAELKARAGRLTPREAEVLGHVGRGLLNKQIAFEMGLSEITVKMHRSSAGRKIGSISVADMIRKIELLGL